MNEKFPKVGSLILLSALIVFSFFWLSREHYQQDLPDQEIIAKKFLQEDLEEGENPGAFNEALIQLKTSKDGRTYKANYKQLALNKAKALKNVALQQIQGVQGTQGQPLNWKEVGPGNVSGRTRAVVVDPSDQSGNTWFAASIGGGVWKTTNAGVNWENKTPNMLTLTTTTLAIAESNPNVIYVGTGMGYGRIVDLPGSGIWKSVNGGDSWQQLQSTANGQLFAAINRIIVDPNDENIVLACSNGFSSHLGPKPKVNGTYGEDRKSGIFRSTDGGLSWNQVYDPDAVLGTSTDNRVQQLLPDPNDFNIIYATVNEVGILKSIDAGLTWTLLSGDFVPSINIGVPGGLGLGLEGISTRIEMAIAPSNTDRLYAAVERPQGQKPAFFMSKDKGATWVEVPDTGNAPNWFDSSGGTSRNSAWFNNTILVSPYDENVVFVGGVNVYRINIDDQNDNRTTIPIAWWINNNQGLPVIHADQHFMASIPVDQATNRFKLVIGNDGGVAYSQDNGTTWAQRTGLITTQFYGADKKPGENVYVGGMQDNGTWLSSTNPSVSSPWNFVGGGDGVEVAWNANNANQIIIGSQGGNLSRSTDGGATFISIPDAKGGVSPFVSKIANSKTDPELVFTVGFQGVKRSDDFGQTWSLTTINGNWLGYRPFDNVEISNADPRKVWISSRMDVDPATQFQGGIHVSDDAGVTFQEISNNFPSSVTEASGIATHPTDGSTAYFLFSEPGAPKILKTTDLGQTFTDLSGFDNGAPSVNAFPDVGVFSLLVMPYDHNVIWAGTEIGLFISEDGGQSWLVADNGMPNVAIFQMSIVEGQILVATQGRGVWTVQLPELVNYNPPVVTLTPRLRNFAMSPADNGYRLDVELRSAYDSAHIISNGNIIEKIEANNSAQIINNSFDVTTAQTISAQVIAYKDGSAYKSDVQSIGVFPLEPLNSFSTDFDNASIQERFINNGFSITTENGFSSAALNTTHPYPNATNLTSMLKNPIVVSEENALMAFKEIALVEEGTSSDFTNPNFFDFVIVEGTSNGIDWVPLISGYDSRVHSAWSAALAQSASGNFSIVDEGLYRNSAIIHLDDQFSAGQKIFIRFRLLADPAVNGWGWAIDDLSIQETITGFEDEVSQGKLAVRSFPNPTSSNTTVEYHLPKSGKVNVRIIDGLGNSVVSEELGVQTQGTKKYLWNASDRASGIYIVKIETPFGSAQTKVIKIE